MTKKSEGPTKVAPKKTVQAKNTKAGTVVKTAKPAGRPVRKDKPFYQELMLAAISSTEKGLKKLCEEFRKEDPKFPSHMSFIRWTVEDEGFRALYTRAKEEQAEILAEQIIDISDDDSLDIGFKEDGTPFIKGDNIQRARLRVESRKWIASKLKPKKYGDKLAVGGDDGGPIRVALTISNEDANL